MSTSDPLRRIRAVVRGRVQGVNFRAATQRKAQSLNLRGWVRNLPNGAVETVAEGSESRLSDFIQYLHQGPPSAQVTDVECLWEDPEGQMQGFEIRYF